MSFQSTGRTASLEEGVETARKANTGSELVVFLRSSELLKCFKMAKSKVLVIRVFLNVDEGFEVPLTEPCASSASSEGTV